jgi:hypothetical protein
VSARTHVDIARDVYDDTRIQKLLDAGVLFAHSPTRPVHANERHLGSHR